MHGIYCWHVLRACELVNSHIYTHLHEFTWIIHTFVPQYHISYFLWISEFTIGHEFTLSREFPLNLQICEFTHLHWIMQIAHLPTLVTFDVVKRWITWSKRHSCGFYDSKPQKKSEKRNFRVWKAPQKLPKVPRKPMGNLRRCKALNSNYGCPYEVKKAAKTQFGKLRWASKLLIRTYVAPMRYALNALTKKQREHRKRKISVKEEGIFLPTYLTFFFEGGRWGSPWRI